MEISSADQLDASPLLLAWARMEWQQMQQPSALADFDQLTHSPFLYTLLQRVHPTHFAELNHLSCEYTPYLSAIEEYLSEADVPRHLRRPYRKQLAANQPIEEMIKLTLLLLMQS